jgi:phage gpG-like protein
VFPLEELARKMGEIAPEVWGATVRDAAKKLAVMAVSGARKGIQDGVSPDGKPYKPLKHPRPGGGRDKPLQDKGLLKASLSASVTEGGLKLQASHPGANVHQFGAKIKARGNKRLAIPLTKEAKRVGSPRKNNFPRKLFVIGTDKSTAYLAEAVGKGKAAKIVIHYALVKEVNVPARPFVGFSAETMGNMAGLLEREFAEHWKAAIEAAYRANPLIKPGSP